MRLLLTIDACHITVGCLVTSFQTRESVTFCWSYGVYRLLSYRCVKFKVEWLIGVHVRTFMY